MATPNVGGVNRDLQFYGLIALSVIAIAILVLIGWVLYLIGSHITADGRVPAADSFGFTGLLLGFREVIGALKGIWDYEARAQLTQNLADSAPTPGQPTKTTVEGEGQ